MKQTLSFVTLFSIAAMTTFAHGQINYDESVNGDLGTAQSPSNLGAAGLGANNVSGTLFNSSNFDPDAFSFTVGAGLQLDSLSFTSMDGAGSHFFAFNDGPLSTGSGAGNLISTLINAGDVGTNILDGTLNSFGGSGLNGDPLGPGTYYVWFQETAGSDHNYTIQFTTSQAIPEPATASLIMLGALGLGIFNTRRRS